MLRQLRVTDTEVGMDASVRERLFEAFFTTKGPGKGTRLGLATVYGIIEQHGSITKVVSEQDKCSTFRVFLPVTENSERDEFRSVIIDETPSRGGNETILNAEAHDGIRDVACAALKAKGYQILMAHDGQEAIDVISANRDGISLGLLDVIMPQLSGPQVFRVIKALKPEVSVLFVIGYSNGDAALAVIVESGVAFLRKPYRPALLCRKVRDVLDAAGALHPERVRFSSAMNRRAG